MKIDMKDYLTREPDPTLSQTRWAILILWAVTASIIVCMFMPKKPWLKQPVSTYELNGYMQNSNYIWGEIK